MPARWLLSGQIDGAEFHANRAGVPAASAAGLELAKAATELYAKQAMMELAEEFNKAADALERKAA